MKFVLHEQNEPSLLIQTVCIYVNMLSKNVSLLPFTWRINELSFDFVNFIFDDF